MRKLYEIIILCIAAVVLIGVCAAAIHNIDADTADPEVIANVNADEYEGIQLINCNVATEAEMSWYTPENNNSQIILPCTGEEINCVKLDMSVPLEYDTFFELCYEADNGDASETYYAQILQEKGSKTVFFNLPAGNYKMIKLRHDRKCSLASVQLGYIPNGHIISAENFLQLAIYNSHCDISENGSAVYTIDSADPQIWLSCADMPVNCVKVNFSVPLEEDTYAQIYYASDGEGFSEGNSVVENLKKGASFGLFYIPEGIYTSLRMDINSNCIIKNTEECLISSYECFETEAENRIIIDEAQYCELEHYNCHMKVNEKGETRV